MSNDVQTHNGDHSYDENSSFFMKIVNKIINKIRNHIPFTVFVIGPTLIAAFYLFLIAAPQYISEAHFVVHGKSSQSGFSLSNILQSSGTGGGGSSSENTYVVQDFMQSRDAAQLLIKNNGLLDIYARPEADFIAKYPILFLPKNFEHFYEYYKRHVLVEQDSETNISILTVRTFRAQDSYRVARALLDAGEQLVNEINRRQRENLIRATSVEVQEAETKLRDINQKLAEYRNVVALIDPLRQSVPMVGFVTSLQNMLATTNMQLNQLEKSAPNSPLIPAYQHQAAILSEQIKKSGGEITGSGETLVAKITGYEDLMVQRDIQQRILISNVASLEAAKEQANQQMIYVEEVSQPNVADWAEYPESMMILAIVFLSALGLYVMGSLLVAGAHESKLQ